MCEKSKKGFTLVEIMITTAILAAGMVLIFQAFLAALNSSTYIVNHLDASLEMTNKIWEMQDLLRQSGSIRSLSGEIKNDNPVTFQWRIGSNTLNNALGFYADTITLSWEERNRQVTVSRGFYISK